MLVAGLRYCLGLGIAACATRFVNRYIFRKCSASFLTMCRIWASRKSAQEKINNDECLTRPNGMGFSSLEGMNQSTCCENLIRAPLCEWIELKKEALCETKSLFPSSIVTQFNLSKDMTWHFFCSNGQHIQLLEACVHTPAHASRA